MAPWIVAGIAISIALATFALGRARSSPGVRGMFVSAAASWIVAALAWVSLFAANWNEGIGLGVMVVATVLGMALIVSAARRQQAVRIVKESIDDNG